MNKTLKTILYTVLIVLALAAFTLMAVQLTTGPKPLFDFTAFWLAGKLTLEGKDPYNSADWIPVYEPYDLGLEDNQTFLYPKPILPLFIPFNLLPLRAASIVWLVLAQVCVFASALLLTRTWPDRPLKYILPLLISIFLNRSYQATLALGQLGGFFLILLTGSLLVLRREKWALGGALLSLLALKPQLGIPVIAMVSVWFLLERRWSYFYGLGGGLLALLAVGLVFDPSWVGKFLSIGGDKVSQTFGYHPTLWGLTGYLCGREAGCSFLWGGVLTAGFVAFYLWLILAKRGRLDTTQVLAFAVVFALILTPYSWIYDQLLLLVPLTVAVGLMIEKKFSFLLTTLTPVLFSGFTLLLLPIAVQQKLDVWSALVPLVMLGILLFAAFTGSQKQQI